MAVLVRPVRVDDDAEIDLLRKLYTDTVRAHDADAHVYGRAEYVTLLRSTSPELLSRAFVAEEDGQVLGSSLLQARLTDNTHTAHCRVWVPPRFTGRGAGSRLAEHAERWAAAHGRRVLTCAVEQRPGPPDATLGFATRRGYTVAQVEEERRLPLPVPDGWWDELAEEAHVHHTGYTILAVPGPVAPDLAQGYCDVYNQLVLDAPQGNLEVTGPARRTPELLTARDHELRDHGAAIYHGFGVHERSGQVVALCTLVAHAGTTHLSQWSTIVARAHRGHRLGLAVKTATYRMASHAHPDRTRVVTWNADDNAPMIAVNERLGFILRGRTLTLQKPL